MVGLWTKTIVLNGTWEASLIRQLSRTSSLQEHWQTTSNCEESAPWFGKFATILETFVNTIQCLCWDPVLQSYIIIIFLKTNISRIYPGTSSNMMCLIKKKKDTQNFNDLKYLQVKNHILLHFYAASYSFYTYFSLYVNRRAKVR